jgi:hypothetical protein
VVTDPAVDALLATLDHACVAEARQLRALILGLDPSVREEIKWNAPSFRAPGDFATFQLRKRDELRVILHRGAKVNKAPPPVIDDPEQRLSWLGTDRAMLTVRRGDDVSALVPVLRAWMLQCAGGAGTGPGAAVMPSPQAVAR